MQKTAGTSHELKYQEYSNKKPVPANSQSDTRAKVTAVQATEAMRSRSAAAAHGRPSHKTTLAVSAANGGKKKYGSWENHTLSGCWLTSPLVEKIVRT